MSLQMVTRLFRREHILEQRMNHRERAVAHATDVIARMQQIANLSAFEQRIAREHAIDDQQALKVSAHRVGPFLESRRFAARDR